MKKRSVTIVLGLVLCFTCMWISGSWAASEIALVKNGVLFGNQTTTIGAVLEGSFDNPAWIEFVTVKGQRVVEFSGNISVGLHQSAVEALVEYYSGYDLYRFTATYGDYTQYKGDESDMGQRIKYYMDTQWWPTGTPATIQFLINLDGETFQVGAMESSGWRNVPEETILEIIYR